jgi:chemotaxis protein methyltransferase CheR
MLDDTPWVKRQNEYLMTVSISRFFRDRQFWVTLETNMLPELFMKESGTLNVWCAGCACGEEVYSFKIVWEHLKQRWDRLPFLKILATDLHPEYLKRAQGGTYTASSIRELTQQDKTRFFKRTAKKNLYQVIPGLKENIRWEIHHLSRPHPRHRFQIVFLRNSLLTYYQKPVREPIFNHIVGTLDPFGLLIIGSNEKLPPTQKNLLSVRPFAYVFRKY